MAFKPLSAYIDKMSPATKANILDDLSMSLGGRWTQGQGFKFLGGREVASGLAAAWSSTRAGQHGAALGAMGGTVKRLGFAPLGLLFTGSAAVEGFQEGGMVGMSLGVGRSVLENAAFNAFAMRGLPAIGAAATNPFVIGGLAATAAAGGIAYAGYRAAEMSYQYHLKTLPLETTGSMDAFYTSNAATMRQRSMMNIQRSHLNARSAFGNEAQYSHIARYRGIGKRGTR